MDFNHFLNGSFNESKITLKRRYTENHPAITAGKNARIRNKMLEAIGDGKITQQEFDDILKELSNNGKKWMRSNSTYFNVSEEGISLSKFGRRALASITVNEATTKNPEVWVPGDFDKELFKMPKSKITYDTVKDLAKKHKVFLDDAIAYVEYGWDLDLKENKNTNMKTKNILTFEEFLNEGILESGYGIFVRNNKGKQLHVSAEDVKNYIKGKIVYATDEDGEEYEIDRKNTDLVDKKTKI